MTDNANTGNDVGIETSFHNNNTVIKPSYHSDNMGIKPSSHNIDISVVIPVYNEKESLPELMAGISGTLDNHGKSYEVVFVDDGSSDGSFDEIKSLYKQYDNRIKALRFSRNCGKSAALSAGIACASGEIIISLWTPTFRTTPPLSRIWPPSSARAGTWSAGGRRYGTTPSAKRSRQKCGTQ
jgi:hypothetical protein